MNDVNFRKTLQREAFQHAQKAVCKIFFTGGNVRRSPDSLVGWGGDTSSPFTTPSTPFFIFQYGGSPLFSIYKGCQFQLTIPFGGLICVTLPNFVWIGHTVAEILPFSIFQDGSRLSSWICVRLFRPPTKRILVVFVTVQNSV